MEYNERDVREIDKTGVFIPDDKCLIDFFENYCEDELTELAKEFPSKVSVYINHSDVYRFSKGLTAAIEGYFNIVENYLKFAIVETKILSARTDLDEIEKQLQIRIRNPLPALKQTIRNLTKKDIGKLVYIDGYARVVSDTEPKYTKAVFECLRCGHETVIEQRGDKFLEPVFCENDTCGKKGPFKEKEYQSEYIDFQKIQIQELPDSTTGTKTQDIIVECDEDLTNKVRPGDRVSVVGIMMLKPKFSGQSRKNINEKVIKALSIEKLDIGFEDYILTQKDEDEILELSKNTNIKQMIVDSIAPSIHGCEEAKEAIALNLFSGVKKVLPDMTTLRGVIHAALVGDPGGAKSLMLRRAVKISPRGVYASGRTASAAGLTAATVKDPLNEGSWMLEGGAAVMASGGTLAIDEIGQARDEDKSALHEVMEQGSVSIAKAGNVVTLRAECGVVIAGNPKKGYFNNYDNLAEQLDLPPALWSRIDLMFFIKDEVKKEKDAAISDHILRNHRVGGMIQNLENAKNPIVDSATVTGSVNEIVAPISDELLRMYIAYSRMYIFPVTSAEVSEHIKSFYLDVRGLKNVKPNNPVPITPRTLEAIQRIAEAYARMRLSNTVSIDDVINAKTIVGKSLKDVGMNEHGELDASVQLGHTSESQQERIEILRDAIRNYSAEDSVLLYMEGLGHKKAQVLHDIKKLSERGQIYKSDLGGWKLI